MNSKPRIMIVDDKVENLISLEKLLEDLEVDFVRALSGNEALTHSLKGDYALAIMDVQMPGMDGYEAVEIMRQSKRTKHIPVIFVSAIYSDSFHAMKGIESGAVDFLSKPIIPEILKGKVQIFLEMYRKRTYLESVISELQQTQQNLEEEKKKAELATRSKSMFLANMSHEIRTPLNGIIGMIELIKNADDLASIQEYISIVDASSTNLLTIINDVLDFSKIESDQVELEDIDFNVVDEINSVIKLLKLKADDKGVIIRKEQGSNIPEYLVGDPVRYKQILMNLINNAIKFTHNGFVRIFVEVKEDDHNEGNEVLLLTRVKDTGIGISADGKDKLFKEFSQTEASTTRKFGGTGLGLAICKMLSFKMGGEIGVNSTEGIGSEFWFTVRLQKSDGKHLLKDKTVEKAVTGRPLHLLIVDDNQINRSVAQFNLKKLGHTTDFAENGQEGYEKWSQSQFDAVLMDIQMPILNGYESTAKIRKAESTEGKPAAWIIAMTANAQKGEREYCINSGMDDYLSKPFKQDDLIKVLNRVP